MTAEIMGIKINNAIDTTPTATNISKIAKIISILYHKLKAKGFLCFLKHYIFYVCNVAS